MRKLLSGQGLALHAGTVGGGDAGGGGGGFGGIGGSCRFGGEECGEGGDGGVLEKGGDGDVAAQETGEPGVGLNELEGGAADVEEIVVKAGGGVGEDLGPEGGEGLLEVGGRDERD